MSTVITYFYSRYKNTSEAQWLKKLLALYALYKCFYWLLHFGLLFSADNMVYHREVALGWWRNLVFLLFNHASPALSIVFISLTIVSAVYILFFKQYQRLAVFLLWFSINNISNDVFCTMSGGDVVFHHLLFFSIFLYNGVTKKTPGIQESDTVFHNAGVLALQIQVCLIYFLAGYAKLLDSDWINGTAVSHVLAVKDFSLRGLYEVEGTMTGILNYFVIGYQLLFPALVWIRKIKKWYLLIGVLQHLFIAFVIGLPSFGFIMIIAYAIFYVPGSKTQKTL